MTNEQRDQNDLDRINQLELALMKAQTIFHAQIKEFSAEVVGNDYLEMLAMVGVDVCDVALNNTTADIKTQKPDNNLSLN